MALSVKEIENSRPGEKDRKLHDEKGLYLLIGSSGSKRWYLKYRHAGVERKLSFGPYPEVTLKAARIRRDEARAIIADGKDPQREKRASERAAALKAVSTFGAIARELIGKRAAEGMAPATVQKTEWLLSLLEPDLGREPIADISAPQLLQALQSIHGSGRRETARRLKSFAGRVFQHAIVTGRAQYNPSLMLTRVLAAPVQRHHPALVDRTEVGALLNAIDGYDGYPSTTALLRLSPHVFQRPGEIRTMEWGELDLDRAVWTIPASKMKMRRPHRVPLSRQAVEIVRSVADNSGGSELVFPAFNSRRVPVSENTANQALRRLGYAGKMTAHGFRSTASSLLNESGLWNPDAIERSLAHEEDNAVRAAYHRADYWDERVRMMQWWSDELDALKRAAL